MKLKGVIDFSFGNFLCLRGFAPLGELSANTQSDLNYQRTPDPQQESQLKRFLDEGKYTFFPELVLCVSLEDLNTTPDITSEVFTTLRRGEGFSRRLVGDATISVYAIKSKGTDPRSPRIHMTATLDLQDKPGTTLPIYRIDGNHRLTAASDTKPEAKKYSTPYCLVVFQNNHERDEFSRVFFHNINFKALHLTKEKNLELILDHEELFPDDVLKKDESFGTHYFLARHLRKTLDLELLPNIRPFLEKEPRTFLVDQFDFLRNRGLILDDTTALSQIKSALVKVNAVFDANTLLRGTNNCGLLASLIYYEVEGKTPVLSFVRWIIKNHLQHIPSSNADDLIAIFDRILASRKRTIFVAMPFNKTGTEDHYATVQRVAGEINTSYNLNPALQVDRIDAFHDGTSYVITDRIIEMLADCGLLIGNLTHCNPNVYHEIGFIMGKAKTEGKDTSEILLFLDETIAGNGENTVGFNLRGLHQIRFTDRELEFTTKLRENLIRHFTL